MSSLRRRISVLVKRNPLLTGLVLLLALGFAVGAFKYESLLVAVGEYLVTDDCLERADAILMLTGDFPARILEVVELYREGYAPLIVLTRSVEPPGYQELIKRNVAAPELHDLNRSVALQLGVPEAAVIVLERKANSTRTEVDALLAFLTERNLESVILVTSRYHTTRALRIFKRGSDGRIKVMMRPSRYDTFDPSQWWRVRSDTSHVLFEYQKLVFYYLEVLAGRT